MRADDAAVPGPEKGRDLTVPEDVNAHPSGASPLGVIDQTGNVWQWTDKFTDTHTRAANLCWGSYYRPRALIWYFPGTYKLNEHGKYLLMAPSKDRAGTLGFRRAMDAEWPARATPSPERRPRACPGSGDCGIPRSRARCARR